MRLKTFSDSYRFRNKTVLIRRRAQGTIDVSLKVNGHIILQVPEDFSRAKIREFLVSQEAWIETHLAKYKKLRDAHPPKLFREDETFYFLGRPRRLKFASGSIGIWYALGRNEITCHVPDLSMVSREGQPWLRDSLTEFYRNTGIRYLRARLAILSRRMKIDVKSLRFASQNSRWGSCSAKGCISLNWRLIFAPPEVIDYVLIHELAHLKQYDHTPAFWKIVAAHVPDYAAKLRWLEKHQYHVDFLAKRSELYAN